MLPKEFVLYTDHQTLQYLNRKGKFNHIYLKWVEFMQRYKFVLKHRSGRSNRLVDALSRRQLLLTEMQIEMVEFNELKNCTLRILIFLKHRELVKNLLL